MKPVRKVLDIVTLLLVLLNLNCNQQPDYIAHLDLDGDGKKEIITGSYEILSWNKLYSLETEFSNPDGTYGEPRLIMQFEGKPEEIWFEDNDDDKDLDLFFSKYKGFKLTFPQNCFIEIYINYATYVSENDGKRNFDEQKLVKQEKKLKFHL